MEQVIHRSNTRGHHNYGWLDTRHTFSFAQYFDPQRTGFGALRVLNDDVVKPNMGFGEHPHDNMEIISIPIKGTLKHKDSAGHEQIIKEHEVQVMSAGTGVFHSEYNASKDEDVNFLQIWIYPDKKNVSPSYNQKYFEAEDAQDKWQFLVGPNGEDGLHINQNATISRTFLKAGNKLTSSPAKNMYGTYFFVIEGEVKINDAILHPRDGMGISGSEPIELKAKTDAYILKLEVPEKGFSRN